MAIIPALLTKNSLELQEQILKFSYYFPRLHIDIADGMFVNNITIQLKEALEIIKKLIAEKKLDKQISFDFHLMIEDYHHALDLLCRAPNNINTVFIHTTKNKNKLYNKLLDYKYKLGIVYNPNEPVKINSTKSDTDVFKSALIMSVIPGFQGSPFIPETLTKIKTIKKNSLFEEVQIDGGINNQTLPLIHQQEYQPDNICIGSYLAKLGHEQIKQLRVSN